MQIFLFICCCALLYFGYVYWKETEDFAPSQLFCWETIVIALSPLLYLVVSLSFSFNGFMSYTTYAIIIVMLLLAFPLFRFCRRCGFSILAAVIPLYLLCWSDYIEEKASNIVTVEMDTLDNADKYSSKRLLVRQVELDTAKVVSYIIRSNFKKGHVHEDLFIPIVGNSNRWLHFSFYKEGYSSANPLERFGAEETRIKWRSSIMNNPCLSYEVVCEDEVNLFSYLQPHNENLQETIEGAGVEMARTAKSPQIYRIARLDYGDYNGLLFIMSMALLIWLYWIAASAVSPSDDEEES